MKLTHHTSCLLSIFGLLRTAKPRALAASILLVLGLTAVIALPARAQNTITLFLNPTYVPLSFGRQLSFSMEPNYAPGNTLSSSTLVVNLPPGVSFVSADPSAFDRVAVTSVSGSSATGERVTLSIGLANSNFLVFSNILSVSIENTVADGTMLQATFDLSGTLSTTGTTADSGPVPLTFQAGFLPVSVSLASYEASCGGDVRNGDFSFSRFSNSSSTGTATSGSVTSLLNGGAVGGLAAIAQGTSERLSTVLPAANTPVKVGDITGPNSVLRFSGIGGSALAYGGYALLLTVDATKDPPVEVFTASNLPASVICVQNLSVGLSFSNPNPYDVPLIFDQRTNVFLAAGNGAATDQFLHPFDFPSSVSTDLTVGNGNVTDIGSGVATSTIFERFLFSPSGNTREVAYSITCFPEGQSTCADNPPSDTTKSLSGSGGFLVGRGVSNGPFGSLEFDGISVDAQGRSNIATDANTGSVTAIRTGYGSGSGAVSLRFYRGDANLPAVQSGDPAKLRFTGGSPIELMVSDAQGRRAGFQLAPSPPPQFLDAQPSVLTEIFGASYSGIDSHPQVIEMPDPKPGTYQVQVIGTDTGSFLLTTETLDINDRAIDSQSVSGNATPGSTNSFSFDITADGRVSIPGTPGNDTIPPTTTASLSPQPNAAGWNKNDVTVTLTAADNAGGSGVKQITYSASGAQAIASATVHGSFASVVISSEGITTLTFFATDNASNVESAHSVTIKLDKTPPSIAGSQSAAPNANGWNNSNVTVHFACSDALSGLVPGSSPADTILSAEGAGQSVQGTCQDVAGNSASATVLNINIDKTPPVVSCSARPNSLWPPDHKLVPVNVSVVVTDSLSGPAGSALLSATSNEPDSGLGDGDTPNDIQGFVPGALSTSGQLRAERSGPGTGRVYMLVYQGKDRAGNTAACATTITVPHDQGTP